MSMRLHRLDLRYAAMSDDEIEQLWRAAQGGTKVALVRQLVLRSVDVIEATCQEAGEGRGFSGVEVERASDETVLRLFARLYANPRVKSVRALAHALAREVVADSDRSRSPLELRLAARRPRLRLVEGRMKR